MRRRDDEFQAQPPIEIIQSVWRSPPPLARAPVRTRSRDAYDGIGRRREAPRSHLVRASTANRNYCPQRRRARPVETATYLNHIYQVTQMI